MVGTQGVGNIAVKRNAFCEVFPHLGVFSGFEGIFRHIVQRPRVRGLGERRAFFLIAFLLQRSKACVDRGCPGIISLRVQAQTVVVGELAQEILSFSIVFIVRDGFRGVHEGQVHVGGFLVPSLLRKAVCQSTLQADRRDPEDQGLRILVQALIDLGALLESGFRFRIIAGGLLREPQVVQAGGLCGENCLIVSIRKGGKNTGSLGEKTVGAGDIALHQLQRSVIPEESGEIRRTSVFCPQSLLCRGKALFGLSVVPGSLLDPSQIRAGKGARLSLSDICAAGDGAVDRDRFTLMILGVLISAESHESGRELFFVRGDLHLRFRSIAGDLKDPPDLGGVIFQNACDGIVSAGKVDQTVRQSVSQL